MSNTPLIYDNKEIRLKINEISYIRFNYIQINSLLNNILYNIQLVYTIKKNVYLYKIKQSRTLYLNIFLLSEKLLHKLPLYFYFNNCFNKISYRMYAQLSHTFCHDLTAYTQYMMHYPHIHISYNIYAMPYSFLKYRSLKEFSFMNLILKWYKKPGPAQIRLKLPFPSINIAIRFKISKYVIF